MRNCVFVTDLHGKPSRYEKLLEYITAIRPYAVFLGGDLLPHGFNRTYEGDFLAEVLIKSFIKAKESFPGLRIFIILGNDDPMTEEPVFINFDRQGLWDYVHRKVSVLDEFRVFGYAFVPPTPFRYKDWERYDVSASTPAGCISPEDGIREVDPGEDISTVTIKDHLDFLTGTDDLARSIFLFHSPPYNTCLDRAALDGRVADGSFLDVHVGSIAIRDMIVERQPLLTMHGHIHESSSITGRWVEWMGRTPAVTAAWPGPELAVVEFDLDDISRLTRKLL